MYGAVAGEEAISLVGGQLLKGAGYAALPVIPQSRQGGADPALLESGQRIAENGVWSKSVPPCYGCHGPNGEGIPPSFPAIVEQPKAYVVAQLTAWQQGKRAADPMGLMKAVASRLSSAEMDAVATWLASVQPPPAKKSPASSP